MSNNRRMAAVLGAAGMALLAVSGCGNGGTTPTPTGAATPTPAITPSVTSSATAQATSTPLPAGTQLNSLLLNVGNFPKGFAVIAANTRHTAGSTAPDSPSPMPTTQWCERLTGTSWIAVGGIDSATWAQREYVNSGKTETIGEEIDTFTGTDGTKVMAELWKAFGRCETFTQDYRNTRVRMTLVRSKLAHMGSQAIQAVETSPAFLGGTTLVAIQVGNSIVTCIYSSEYSDLGAAAVTWAERIGKRLPAS